MFQNLVEDKRLLIVSGKGGIGKSLISAAIGQYAAEMGLKTLIIEHTVEEQIPPLFGKTPVGNKETEISDNLFSVNLSFSQCLEEYISIRLGKRKLFETIFNHNITKTFLDTIPGLGETMLLGRMYYTCELDKDSNYDLVVFDAPASGHFLSLLTTPEAVINTGMGGPIMKEVEKVEAFLKDTKKTGTILVTVPEELIVSESLDFIPKIQKDSPNKIVGIVVNRSVDEVALVDNTKSSLDKEILEKLGPSLNFIHAKLRKSKTSQATLMKGLKDLKVDFPILLTPELGAIREPLAKGFAKKLLEAGHDSA